MAAQFIVQQGLRWFVGNCESIRVWGDKWLLSTSTYKVVSSKLFLHEDTRVSEVIDSKLASWKGGALDAMFLPYEAKLIKSIPISLQLPKDKLIWALSSNSVFSVHSAYKLAMDQARAERSGTSSDNGRIRKFWRHLWRLEVPHKVRHFSWRAVKGILPTKVNLLRCGVIHDDRCNECNVEAESEGHLLWSCHRAQDVWQNSKLYFNFELHRIWSFQDLMWMLLMSDNPNEDSAKVVVMIAWAIWHNWNEVRHGGRKKNGMELAHSAKQYLQEFNEANVSSPKLNRNHVVA